MTCTIREDCLNLQAKLLLLIISRQSDFVYKKKQTNNSDLLSHGVVNPSDDSVFPASDKILVPAAVHAASFNERACRIVEREGERVPHAATKNRQQEATNSLLEPTNPQTTPIVHHGPAIQTLQSIKRNTHPIQCPLSDTCIPTTNFLFHDVEPFRIR